MSEEDSAFQLTGCGENPSHLASDALMRGICPQPQQRLTVALGGVSYKKTAVEYSTAYRT